MKYLKISGVLALAVLLLSGCMTQHQIDQELENTHRQAYNDWKQQRSLVQDTAATRDSLAVSRPGTDKREVLVQGDLALKDAIKLSLLYNRSLEQVLEEQKYAQGRILSSYGSVTPNIVINGSYTRREQVSSFEANGRKIKLGALDNYSATLNVTQPIFAGGSLGAGLRAARLYQALTDKNIQAATEQTIFRTKQSYYQVLLLQEQLSVSRDQVELSKAHLNDVQNKKKYGTASRFNELRAKVELSNAQTQMMNLKNSLDQAKAQLYRTLGVSQNSKVTLSDSLEYVKVKLDESEAIKTAYMNRPELKSSRLSVRLQEQSVRSAYSGYFPSINAYFQNTWARPNPFIQTRNEWGRIWNAGFNVSWSIFNLGREGKVLQEKSNLRQQQISYYNTREQVLYEVHSAVLAVENERKSLETQQLVLKQAKEGLRLAEAGYKEGTLEQVAVLDARHALTQAQFQYYATLHDYDMARLRLQKATGQLRAHLEDVDAEKVLEQND